MEGAAVGIDLGTTNSAVAVRGPDGRVVVVPPPGSPSGRPTMPSVVAYNAAGTVVVGPTALLVKPDGVRQTVFRSVKRLIGRTYEDAHNAGVDPNALGADPRGRAEDLVRLMLPGGKTIMPEQVLAELIKALVKVAEDYLGTKVTRAVIGVPSRFDMNQSRALEYAAELSGLVTVQLVREPELAVRAYGLRVNPVKALDVAGAIESINKVAGDPEFDPQADDVAPEMRHILVADLGGGTFDVCVVRYIVDWDEIHVLFTAGNDRLGGDDFDEALTKWAERGFKDHLSSGQVRAWPLTAENRMRLKAVARKAKEKLSSAEKADLEFAGSKLTITRSDFNAIAFDTLERMLRPIRECCAGAEVRLPFETLAVETFSVAQKATKDRKKARVLQKDTPQVQKHRISSLRKNLASTEEEKKKKEEEPLPDVDEVLCVGAASWTPAVRELLGLITGVTPTVSFIDPDTAVAVGAAVVANVLDAKIPDMQVHSQWRAAWTHYMLKRPDLMKKLRREIGMRENGSMPEQRRYERSAA